MSEEIHIRMHELPDGEIVVSAEKDGVVEILRDEHPTATGSPLPPATEEDAMPTERDVKSAREAFRRDAPPGFKRLLDAKIEEPEPDA